jgi:hypothetical protein
LREIIWLDIPWDLCAVDGDLRDFCGILEAGGYLSDYIYITIIYIYIYDNLSYIIYIYNYDDQPWDMGIIIFLLRILSSFSFHRLMASNWRDCAWKRT